MFAAIMATIFWWRSARPSIPFYQIPASILSELWSGSRSRGFDKTEGPPERDSRSLNAKAAVWTGLAAALQGLVTLSHIISN